MKRLICTTILLCLFAGCRSQTTFRHDTPADLADVNVPDAQEPSPLEQSSMVAADSSRIPGQSPAESAISDIQLASAAGFKAQDAADAQLSVVTADQKDVVDTDTPESRDSPDGEEQQDKSEQEQQKDSSDQPPPAPFEVPGPDDLDDELTSSSRGVPDVALTLEEVVNSVHQSYPLLEIAALDYQIATGKQTAAWGAFDTKFKASSENGPTGFYQTYRNKMGISTPLYDGGEVFGGYRIGRGDFQPWYQERQTNDGGELKAGFRLPLMRNREIDARRAELWRATYDRQRAVPEIRAQLITFVRDASVAYWKWVALGQQYEVGVRALKLSEDRNNQLEISYKEGAIALPVVKDNLRSIASRETKLLARQRKLRQAAIKLSLYSRSMDGAMLVPDDSQLPEFPKPSDPREHQPENDIQVALAQRPELNALDQLYKRASVDLAEAKNDFLPQIDTQLTAGQDLGEPTSKKRDKSELELEAGLFVEVPVERRKARGKTNAAHAKMHQIQAKRRFTTDKITGEIRFAYAAMVAAWDRVEKAGETRELAEYMADVERTKFDEGDGDLLKVVLREQYAVEAADTVIESLLEYFTARADYDAALANDRPTVGNE